MRHRLSSRSIERAILGRNGVFLQRRGAFSLIELLVSIFVVGILIGILIPALAKARTAAKAVQSGNNLRQLGIVIATYGDESRGFYPVTEDGRFYQVGSFEWVSYPYWQVFFTWPGVVYQLFPVNENREIYVSPLDPRAREDQLGWASSYEYSTSFVGSPRLWSGESEASEILKTVQRESAVAQPSKKALMWDQGVLYADPRKEEPWPGIMTPLMTADLSVRMTSIADATPAVPNPFDNPVKTRQLHNTAMGVLGIDF